MGRKIVGRSIISPKRMTLPSSSTNSRSRERNWPVFSSIHRAPSPFVPVTTCLLCSSNVAPLSPLECDRDTPKAPVVRHKMIPRPMILRHISIQNTRLLHLFRGTCAQVDLECRSICMLGFKAVTTGTVSQKNDIFPVCIYLSIVLVT